MGKHRYYIQYIIYILTGIYSTVALRPCTPLPRIWNRVFGNRRALLSARIILQQARMGGTTLYTQCLMIESGERSSPRSNKSIIAQHGQLNSTLRIMHAIATGKKRVQFFLTSIAFIIYATSRLPCFFSFCSGLVPGPLIYAYFRWERTMAFMVPWRAWRWLRRNLGSTPLREG